MILWLAYGLHDLWGKVLCLVARIITYSSLAWGSLKCNSSLKLFSLSFGDELPEMGALIAKIQTRTGVLLKKGLVRWLFARLAV